LYQSNVGDHPLSSDYRRMLLIYLLKFDIDAMAQDSDIVDEARLCIPCPPNLVCMGNANPPVAIDRIGFGKTKNNTLMYGILPVAASSTQWWVECPNTQNKRAYSRGHSIGLSSCFHVAERWTAQESRLSNKLFSFSFPALLMVESSNTSIITGILNLEQQIYSKHIFANIHKTPTMEFIHTTPAEGNWFVMMEMDMTEVLPLFTDILSQKQEQILLTLDAIDQETGAAFSTLLPLLWAIACTNHTDVSLAVPVFVVPGIVQNSVTEKIVVRAVTQIMQILDVRGEPPQHVFQLNSQQVLSSVSKAHTTSRPLLFVHNNICDADNNPDEDYESCRKKFPGTLVSSYTISATTEIRLLPGEFLQLERSKTLHQKLAIGSQKLTSTRNLLCPLNTLTAADTSSLTSVSTPQPCSVCQDDEFWNLNECSPCDVALDGCEKFAANTRSKPCSWTRDLTCTLLTR